CMRLERYDDALEAATEASAMDPSDLNVALDVAWAAHGAGDRARAKSAARAVAEGDPLQIRAWALLAEEARLDQEWPEMEACLAKVTALDPRSSVSWHQLGVVRINLEDHAGAAEAFRKAIALDPSNVLALACLADTLPKVGRAEEALAMRERAAA